MPEKYKEEIPFVKPAPIELEEAKKANKKGALDPKKQKS
jgi:hypothetical protein